MVKLGVIMPHRNDRPQFLEQFHRLLEKQTLQPDILEIVDYEAKSDSIDISERYKYGYNKLKGKGLDVIAFMENDDFYATNYLETMVNGWVEHGKPEMFGTSYTIYYHIGLMKHFTFEHSKRSSMMSTLMKPDLPVLLTKEGWPADDYPYTDSHLWINSKNKAVFRPKEIICLGIKHGIGMSGGRWHDTTNQRDMRMYKENKLSLLKIVGEENYEFYRAIAGELSSISGK